MDKGVLHTTPPASHEQLTPQQALTLRGLTRREVEAALLAGQGLSGRAIAERLVIAPGTVKSLLARARRKLGCQGRGNLAIHLLRERIVSPLDLLDPRDEKALSRQTAR